MHGATLKCRRVQARIGEPTSIHVAGVDAVRATALNRSRSFDAVEFATLEWVDWFNNRRLLEPVGNIPPAEAEEHYYATLDQPAMAA